MKKIPSSQRENLLNLSQRAQIEQIFSEAGWNFLNIAVSPEDTSLFTIYNTN